MPKTRIPMQLLPLLLLGLATALPAAAQVASVDELSYPPMPSFDVPQPTRVVLDNGLVVMLLEDHELPLIDVLARIRTGGRHEPADKVGLASLTGTVLRTGGTQSRSGDEIDDYLESRAASIETSIDTEAGSASMSCLAEDFGDVLGLFAEILRQPVFDEDKLAVAKNQLNTGIARQNDSPQSIVFREFSELVYGPDSPYARIPTYSSVAAVGREDLVAWHRLYFHPNNVILGVVGDFDSDEVLAEIRRVFGDWPAGPEAPAPAETFEESAAPGVYYVRKDDVTQSNILMGHLGIRRDNPDYLAVDLLNEVFSGSFASRLFSNVRTKKGLAYGVFGGIGAEWDHPGETSVFMSTKTETTGAGIEALFEEVRRLSADPPDERELDKALSGILNSFVFNSDSARKILSQQLTYEYYGYPLDWLSRYYDGIQKVTLDELRLAAEKYIHPERFAIVVVGPAEGRDKPLSEYGKVSELDISIPPLAVETAAATDESRRRGGELLAKAVAAHGGAERIDSIASIRQNATAVASTPQGEMQLGITELFVYPDRHRQELELPFGVLATVVTPDDAFRITPQGVQELPDSQRADSERSMRRDLFALLRRRDTVEAVATGAAEVAGRAVDTLQIDLEGDLVTLALDAESGIVVQVGYRGQDFTGAPGQIVQTLSDYREVGGLQIAFQADSSFEGKPMVSATTGEVAVDAEFDPSEFARPQEAAAAAGG